MNNKKWLAALAIIAVLAVAFFWGGDYGKSTQPGKGSEAASQVVEEDEVPLYEESEQPTTTPDIAGANEPSLIPQETESVIAEAGEPSPVSTDTGTPSATPEPKPDKDAPSATNRPAETKAPATTQPSKEPSKDKEKDKYLTDPVPSGKPKPVEPQDVTVDKSKELTVTLSVSAATILDNLDKLDKDKLEVLPKDGVIYKARKVTFYEGESVFDVLLREMKANKIHMEFEMTPIYNSNYIEGINNLYEFDCGELSGWMYKVNGWFPNYGSSRYTLKDGDVVDWVYTCDLGRDVGGDTATGGTGQ
ncbi:DUF4430 domain-containing protein [Paenibacillus sp. YIM B09110]|uniref:DUF4430 domain-containing protein n=1 Tax=Paenibacillus sp. YIM B09110 TaxID=3126102 RepID=UPI00301B836F